MVFELQSGIIERFRVTPSSRFAMLMGSVLKDVVAFLIPAFIVLTFSSCLGYEIHITGIVLQLILLSILTMMVSEWAGSFVLIFQDVGGVTAVITLLLFPLTRFEGILLLISYGPLCLQSICRINL